MRKFAALHFAALAAAATLTSNARAATLTWDPSGPGGSTGGAGQWNTTDAFWDNAGSPVAWNNSGQTPGTTDDALFNGTAASVTVVGTGVTARSLQFDTTGYTLAAGGGTVTLAGGTGVINTNLTAAQVATINVPIGGSTGLTKTGAGILALGAGEAYSGGTTISAGTVRLESNNAVDTAGTLNIGAGTSFNLYRGTGAGTASNERYNQTVAGLTGSGTLRFGQNAAQQTTNVLTVDVSGTQTFTGTVNTNATGGSRRAAITKSGAGTQIWSPTSADLLFTDLRVTAGTFQLGTTNVGGYINLTGTGGTLELNGLNMSFDSTAGPVINNVSGTTSTIGTAFTGKNWGSRVAGNIRVKANAGHDVTLTSTSNSFSGGVDLTSAGAVVIGAATNLPANQIDLASGRLDFTAGLTLDNTRTFTVGGGTSSLRYRTNSAGTVSLQGTFSNSGTPGTLEFVTHPSNTGVAIYSLSGGGTYTGTMRIGSPQANITLRPGATNGVATGSVLDFGGGNGRTHSFELNGFSQQVAGLQNTAAASTAVQRVLNTSATPATFTVNNAAANVFSGTLGGTGGNGFSFAKGGIGELTLAGVNTYTGTTTISNGTLSLTGSLANSNISITGGLLQGTAADSGVLNYNVVGDTANLISLGGTGVISLTDLDLNGVFTGTQTPGVEYVVVNRPVGSPFVTGTSFKSVALPAAYTIDYDGTAANPNAIVVVAVPEPTAVGMVGVGLMGLMLRRRSPRA